MASERVFLTGATGFLGGELLRQLLAAGFQVRILVRKPWDSGVPPGVEVVRGDLSDAGGLAEQIAGCRVVFHSAALVSNWVPDGSEFYRTNVHGFLNMLEACRRSGIRTMVYTSSFFALGPAMLPGANEDASFAEKLGHPYAQSKLLARKAARAARATGFPIVTLFPGIIYGPGRRTQGNIVAQMLTDFVEGRIPGLLGDGSQIWSYSHVEDVARGHLLALQRSPGGGEYVLGGDNVSLRDFFAAAAHLTGKNPPRLRIPLWGGALLGAAELLLARLQRRTPKMTSGTVRMMYSSWACDSSRACTELDYRFRSLHQGLRQTLQALRIPIVEPGDSAAG